MTIKIFLVSVLIFFNKYKGYPNKFAGVVNVGECPLRGVKVSVGVLCRPADSVYQGQCQHDVCSAASSATEHLSICPATTDPYSLSLSHSLSLARPAGYTGLPNYVRM